MTEQLAGEQPYQEWLMGRFGPRQLYTHTLQASGPQTSHQSAMLWPPSNKRKGRLVLSTSVEFTLKGPEVRADAKK